MAKLKYELNPGEKIVYKVSCVRHGFWGAYTNTLTITNQSVILEKYGLLNNFKGIERFNYCDISQAIQGEASNGEKQLELYIGSNVEEFALQSGNENELKIVVMAINDQMGPEASKFDYNYYKALATDVIDTDRMLELREKARSEAPDDSYTISGMDFAGTAAKNILKSGDLSVGGIVKGVSKAAGKQKKKGLFSGVMDGVLDDLGVRDIQDEFTEMGNEFRQEFGLKTKMTYAEKKELAELEEKKRKQEAQQMRADAFQNRVNAQRATTIAQNSSNVGNKSQDLNGKMSVKEQMELLQQIKNMLDAGILTQEEFEQKKKEILNG